MLLVIVAFVYSSNAVDEVGRLTSIVDAIPELVLPSQLKFGFEILPTQRSKEAVLPTMEPALAEELFYK